MFARLGIVHADLKPENILIEYDPEAQVLTSLKIIDFGSAFLLHPKGHTIENQTEFVQSTPEYLPPEIQSFLSKRYSNERNINIQDFNRQSYTFDMWALGSIVLEMLSGFPLWLSLKSRVVTIEGKSIINFGIFGVAGRDNGKILAKQQQLMKGGLDSLFRQLLKGFDVQRGNAWLCDNQFVDLYS
jgi:dual specificity tyrosine-phosphorylation-regulated kinase 2/3/4